ncbi:MULTISPECIES: DNA mismatch repair endonuclease MutL [Dorea]|uniref:DNA mismatch repair protein MutL n=1 Tax=Dorea hominis TaxID=2763040 RepID=A0ABR7EUA0_9FIRM|nr:MULTISPECIES: DNA mismatch repair endonuclease MutL [Dorea]MBC5664140.1 DNA mismatch repair endonuclease MutL [Dorea hominis]RHO43115.1 DNA mismatch repair endonuclease MutL [Dorea sp. AM13-35]
MSNIHVLDQITIDKIAAGEVIERPASVVKELVENAIDAGSGSVTVEIKEGGISYMRIADNGCGIARDDVQNAFLRHSTSKIRAAEDLEHIASLGFRGEALSSIAAVSQVEMITKTKEQLLGTRYQIAGGKEEELEDTGASDGTTFLIRQLFYNVPARRKFLKTPITEASHVGDLMTRLALSHPEISFQFINNGQSRLHTSGNGNLKDVIYHVYGREITANLIPLEYKNNGLSLSGYIGAPLISRGNRNFENYFINGRYVKSNIIYRAIEDAYKDFSMQHKFPFTVFHITIDGEHVDVNVHPTKMELRFNNQQEVYNTLYEAIDSALHGRELIPKVTLDEPKVPRAEVVPVTKEKQNFRTTGSSVSFASTAGNMTKQAAQSEMWAGVQTPVKQKSKIPPKEERNLDYFMEQMKKRVTSYHQQNSSAEVKSRSDIFKPERQADRIREAVSQYKATARDAKKQEFPKKTDVTPEIPGTAKTTTEKTTANEQGIDIKANEKPEQMDLFEDRFLDKERKADYTLIGQIFDTYWLVQFENSLYIIDQHAAHERVLYERTLREMKNREFTSQMISPPIILNLTMQEAELLRQYMDRFTRIGFEFEEFGQDSFAVRSVPDNLFSIAKKDLLLEMIDHLSDELNRNQPSDLIDEKIASMSCKAAVKGNMSLSAAEVDTLIGELLLLDNPYHCPHGRPTIISMTKRELEKKFKRIV